MPRVPVLAIDTDPHQLGSGLDGLASRAWAMINDEGYFYLTGDAVLPLDVEPLIDAASRFFSLPHKEKMRFYIGHSAIHRGYVPVGEEGPPDEEHDLKEGFDSGLPQLFGADDGTGWPPSPGFHTEVTRWKQRMGTVARSLAVVFARSMNLPPAYLVNRATDPPNQLRLLHYPASPTRRRQGVGTHTDFECFTLLAATSGGLVVQRPDGRWTAVAPRPDSLIVTTGDTMEILTNGGLKAGRHRVGWVTESRLSFPYFFSLDAGTSVAPLDEFVGASGRHYDSTTAGEHILRRTRETFRYLR